MQPDERLERVRLLREQGRTPKQIARALRISPAEAGRRKALANQWRARVSEFLGVKPASSAAGPSSAAPSTSPPCRR